MFLDNNGNEVPLHFSGALEMIDCSIYNGLLKGRFKVSAEFEEDFFSDNDLYMRMDNILYLLSSANKYWNRYYMEKAVREKVLKVLSKKKFGYRWALTEDVYKLRDNILNIKNPVTTKEGKHKFTEIFGV